MMMKVVADAMQFSKTFHKAGTDSASLQYLSNIGAKNLKVAKQILVHNQPWVAALFSVVSRATCSTANSAVSTASRAGSTPRVTGGDIGVTGVGVTAIPTRCSTPPATRLLVGRSGRSGARRRVGGRGRGGGPRRSSRRRQRASKNR